MKYDKKIYEVKNNYVGRKNDAHRDDKLMIFFNAPICTVFQNANLVRFFMTDTYKIINFKI